MRECCKFGKQFGSEWDAEFRTLSIPQAAERFGLTRWAVEQHRKCLGVVAQRGIAPQKGGENASEEPEPTSNPPESGERLEGTTEANDEPTAGELEPEPESFRPTPPPPKPIGPPPQMTLREHPKQIERDDRVRGIAVMLDGGQWGDKNAVKLFNGYMREWGVTRPTMEGYVREAQRMLSSCRGGLLVERQLSIRATQEIRDKALEEGKFVPALMAQTHMDKLRGLLAPALTQINQQFNNCTDEGYSEVYGVIMEALSVPEFALARAAVVRSVEDMLAKQNRSGRETITVEAENAA